MPATAQIAGYIRVGETLLASIEMSLATWKTCSSDGRGRKVREKDNAGGDVEGLVGEFEQAKKKLGLSPDAPVVCCFEAGRDGFWLQRELEKRGVTCVVVDPSSIEVDRRAKRRKTDRIDARKLLQLLIRWISGEPDCWSVVQVPTVEDEDARQLHRELGVLKCERGQHRSRIKSLLCTHGVRTELRRDFGKRLAELRQRDGQALPPSLQNRLRHEVQRLELVDQQIAELEAQRRKLLASSKDKTTEIARKLMRMRSIGINSAWLFSAEVFSWRHFNNRRQLGSFAGLTPTPYASGESQREQGISKAGNPRVRTTAVEIAWCWLRFQPDSALSQWFVERFGKGGRARKVGIVALARKLLVALWRWVEFDIVPEGAQLKAA